MTDSALVGLHLLGLATLVANVVALRRNHRDIAYPHLSFRARLGTWVIGLSLATASLFVSYPLDDAHRIVGFPFMVAAWEKHGDHWKDFAGPLTIPAYLANALLALTLPQLALRLLLARRRRR